MTEIVLQLDNPRTSHGGVKTFRLRDGPHRHKAAVTPAHDPEARGIDWIFFHDRINAGQDIAQIATAKIFHVRAGEIFALAVTAARIGQRSEEHTSELQSQSNLVCRLLLAKNRHLEI